MQPVLRLHELATRANCVLEAPEAPRPEQQPPGWSDLAWSSTRWLVDPLERTIEVNRLHEGAWLRVAAFRGGERVRAEPFEAVELDSAEWFLGASADEPVP